MDKYKFIDLFAGIGGFNLAFDALNAQYVFASEKDDFARKTYLANFYKKSPEIFDNGFYNDDILSINPQNIPDFNILCAGFPCQSFSQAGYKRGFEEDKESRGNMFFVIADIIKAKRPKALFLENVRHLLAHDDGHSFKIIRETIEALGYDFYYQIVKASDYGLPQHRPRLYMIAFDRDISEGRKFHFTKKIPLRYTMSDIMQGFFQKDVGFTLSVGVNAVYEHAKAMIDFLGGNICVNQHEQYELMYG